MFAIKTSNSKLCQHGIWMIYSLSDHTNLGLYILCNPRCGSDDRDPLHDTAQEKLSN